MLPRQYQPGIVLHSVHWQLAAEFDNRQRMPRATIIVSRS
jgi:hypothetical protein